MCFVSGPSPDFESRVISKVNSKSTSCRTIEENGSSSYFIHLISPLSAPQKCSTSQPQQSSLANSTVKYSASQWIPYSSTRPG